MYVHLWTMKVCLMLSVIEEVSNLEGEVTH
jgi:hypothetical protein